MNKQNYTYLLTKEILGIGQSDGQKQRPARPELLKGGCLLYQFNVYKCKRELK